MSRFLTLQVAGTLYALRAEDVAEVIRVPTLARVPQSPTALLGVANLRGSVLPVASLRELLGAPSDALPPSARAIVLDIGAPVAIVVDCVQTLEDADSGQAEFGALTFGPDKVVGKILDIKSLLEAAFANRAAARQPIRTGVASTAVTRPAGVDTSAQTLVTFEVCGQEFALPLEVVQEILPAPATLTAVARADRVVLGITSIRGSLLPLLSLRGLLGFTTAAAANELEKVIVVSVGGSRVGLVADRARAIVAADAALIDAIPPVLAARVGGESTIQAVYRGDAGRRLISILSPEQLFPEDVMQRLAASTPTATNADATPDAPAAELIFLVFRLGDVEFGLPIDAVVEAAQVPAQITRVPKTPKFLEGVINLRGEVLPVVDQRRRFDMPKLDRSEGRKLIVIRTERHRAGLIVDSISDVLRVALQGVEPPPDLTDQMSRLVSGVINLPEVNRIVLLLDPAELLTRAEQGLLDRFRPDSIKVDV